MPKKIKKYKQQFKDTQKDLKKKISMFDQLPDDCSACDEPFDKEDLEQVMSWQVVVRGEERVNLYCPTCWTTATDLVKAKTKEIEDERSGHS
jgi:hypothetical protein